MVREKRTRRIDAPETVGAAIRWAEKKLRAAGVYFGHGTDNSLDEAAWLTAAAVAVPPAELAKHHRQTIAPAAWAQLQALVAQRIATRKPAAYLLREAWFAGLPFYVDERVIVPRSLTGAFIQARFAPWVDPAHVHRILDLCTGSGCMAIACARAFPSAQVDAVDISADALAVARTNVGKYGLGERVRLIRSDLFAAVGSMRYDVIVTNPPYVSRTEMKALPAEYRHEPRLALEAGADGLEFITSILRNAVNHLTTDGILLAEVGNAKVPLQKRFPAVAFTWLAAANGDDCVFLLTAKQLDTCRAVFRR